MTDLDPLTQVLRDVLAGCRRIADSARFDFAVGADTLAAAKKAKATRDLAGVQYLAKRLTPKNAADLWSNGGGGLLLQTCWRAPRSTGLPQAADALLPSLDGAVLVPRRRLDVELDKKEFKARYAPHEWTTEATFTPDGARVLTMDGGKAALWRLADAELDAVYSFGRANILSARLVDDGRVLAIASDQPRHVWLWSHANGKHRKLHLLGDVRQGSLSPDGRFAAGVVERTFEPGVPNDGTLTDDERYEFRVWDVASGAVLSRLFTPLAQEASYYASHAWHPDGRLFVGSVDAIRVLSPHAFAVVRRWGAPRVPRALSVSPDGRRLLAACLYNDERGATTETFPLFDTSTGVIEAYARSAGVWLDNDTLVDASPYLLRVVRLDGTEVATAHFDDYVFARCGPNGEVVTAAAGGGAPGVVEVFDLRRPSR